MTTRWVAYEYEYEYDRTDVRMEGVSFIFTARVKGWRWYSKSISGVGGYDMLDSDGMIPWLEGGELLDADRIEYEINRMMRKYL